MTEIFRSFAAGFLINEFFFIRIGTVSSITAQNLTYLLSLEASPDSQKDRPYMSLSSTAI